MMMTMTTSTLTNLNNNNNKTDRRLSLFFFSFTSTHRTEIFFCPFAYSFNDSLSLSPYGKIDDCRHHSFILSIQYNRTQEKKYEYK